MLVSASWLFLKEVVQPSDWQELFIVESPEKSPVISRSPKPRKLYITLYPRPMPQSSFRESLQLQLNWQGITYVYGRQSCDLRAMEPGSLAWLLEFLGALELRDAEFRIQGFRVRCLGFLDSGFWVHGLEEACFELGRCGLGLGDPECN